ncbi:unnamed protein product, partial [Brassica napus]
DDDDDDNEDGGDDDNGPLENETTSVGFSKDILFRSNDGEQGENSEDLLKDYVAQGANKRKRIDLDLTGMEMEERRGAVSVREQFVLFTAETVQKTETRVVSQVDMEWISAEAEARVVNGTGAELDQEVRKCKCMDLSIILLLLPSSSVRFSVCTEGFHFLRIHLIVSGAWIGYMRCVCSSQFLKALTKV